MSRSFPVRGLRELDLFLSALPKNMERNAIGAGLRAAAAVIRDEAKLQVPKSSGRLARSIKSGSVHKNQDGTFSIRVYPDPARDRHAYLATFMEYGVAPHLIARKVAKRGPAGLRAAVNKGEKVGGTMKIGDRFVSGVISHPGFIAKPFLRPAADIKAEAAVAAFRDKVAEYIEGKTGFAAPLEDAA